MASPVRLVYDEAMPGDLLNILTDKLGLSKSGNLTPGGRYHLMRDLMKFPKINPELEYEEVSPLRHPAFKPFSSVIDVIRKQDILLNYPYHTFNHFIDFMREAAMDPHTDSIYITLYRTAERSKIINTLINAAKNGKKVVVLLELLAQFRRGQKYRQCRGIKTSRSKSNLRDTGIEGPLQTRLGQTAGRLSIKGICTRGNRKFQRGHRQNIQ